MKYLLIRLFISVLPTGIMRFFGCIEIMDHVFTGSRSTILPNVIITSHIVIAAGSLVAKSITESGIYAGHPAKKIGELAYKALVEGDAALEEILRNKFGKRQG